MPETQHIRDSDWTVAPLPADLLDRRAEITGPVDRKMVINALNSGAKMFMADFEDSNIYRTLLPEELKKIKEYVGAAAFENGKFAEVVDLFDHLVKSEEFVDFLTLPAYEMIG